MKYRKDQMLVKKGTNQIYEIKRKLCFVKKHGSLRFESLYKLKGPKPSLNLRVRESELDNRFLIISK